MDSGRAMVVQALGCVIAWIVLSCVVPSVVPHKLNMGFLVAIVACQLFGEQKPCINLTHVVLVSMLEFRRLVKGGCLFWVRDTDLDLIQTS